MKTSTFVVSIDLEADAGYVRMTDRKIVRTVQLGGGINVDLDDLDMVVSVEVLTLDSPIPFERLLTEFHVPSKAVDLLRALQPSFSESFIQRAADGVTAPVARTTTRQVVAA